MRRGYGGDRSDEHYELSSVSSRSGEMWHIVSPHMKT